MGKETLFIFKRTFDDGSRNPHWDNLPDYVIHYLRAKEGYLNALVKHDDSFCITEEFLKEECGIELLDYNNKFISESGKIIDLDLRFDNKNFVKFFNGYRDYLILNVRFMEE